MPEPFDVATASPAGATGATAAASPSQPGPAASLTPKRHWPWLCLAAILLLYIASIALTHPAVSFGEIQDDSIYFASAKALATGQGYILPSFPLPAIRAKYPELYPWLLSWIWRIDPRFPGNIIPAIALTVFFGCWFLIAGFFVARRTLGLSDAWALLVVALCAFNFLALLLSGRILTDLPFAALALTAALAADYSLEPGAHWAWMAAAGALAGLSVGMRTLGVAVVAGIALVALGRRAWKQTIVFCCVAGALTLPWLWPLFAHLLGFGREPAASAAVSPGWQQTLNFYTNYFGVLRQFVPNAAVARTVAFKNLVNLLEEPGSYLLLPLANGIAWLSVLVGSLVSLAAWAGLFARWRRAGWLSLFAIFPLYAAVVVPWPYPPHRFLVPFQPLLFGGLAVSIAQLTRVTTAALRRSSTPLAERGIALVMLALVAVLGGIVAVNFGRSVPSLLRGHAARQRRLLIEKREAYQWIRANSPREASFIAYDDVSFYLYADRKAVRAIACSPAEFYSGDISFARNDARHLADVARHVDAAYWMATSSDYATELGADQDMMNRRQAQLLAGLPVVFRSNGGTVRIYDLRCFQQPGALGCPSPSSAPSR